MYPSADKRWLRTHSIWHAQRDSCIRWSSHFSSTEQRSCSYLLITTWACKSMKSSIETCGHSENEDENHRDRLRKEMFDSMKCIFISNGTRSARHLFTNVVQWSSGNLGVRSLRSRQSIDADHRWIRCWKNGEHQEGHPIFCLGGCRGRKEGGWQSTWIDQVRDTCVLLSDEFVYHR